MKFETERNIFTAFNGRIILYCSLDRPSETDDERSKFLSSLTDACGSFASDKLFLSLTNEYNDTVANGNRFIPYRYSFAIKETYVDDIFLSILCTSMISKGVNVLSSECYSVIFKYDKILPQRLISKHIGRQSVMILSDGGIPIEVIHDNNKLSYRIIDRYSFPI